jgi:hypothetical protein
MRLSKLSGPLLLVAVGIALGLSIAWLKTSHGISPYWFVGAGTALGFIASVMMALMLLRVRRTVFILDWVVWFESLVFTSVLSVLGTFLLCVRLWSGKVAFVITAGLFSATASLIVYVFRNAPSLTWADAEQLVEPEPPPASVSSN